ncbi:penicillin-binding protein 1C [Luteolibacter sp. LG18]|uniref:penicillin-binding protein 1C n=1 Tax=Luteolibacter sp. LG18 TaxID=2819286 RepID=UPI002B28CB1B|nr:penicillin-binding protein 1C [Luteolibacter sp. LG18]
MRAWWHKLKSWRRPVLRSAALLSLVLGAGWCLLPKPELYPPDLGWSRVVRDRHGAVLHISPAPDGRYRLRTPLAEIHPTMVRATLEKEDRWFRWHPGVNPVAVARSLWGVATGRPLGGASTLTMQVARMRWGLQTRGPGGKLLQMFRAIQLERHYTKDQILEAYCDLAPYGGNVEGIGAAARLWCGKSAADLSERESFALGIIPQSPATRHPGRAGDQSRIAVAQARLQAGLAGPEALRDDPLAASFTLVPPGEPPHRAPHFCRRMMNEDASAVVDTTLDLEIQDVLEQGIAACLDRTSESGIRNACAVLVHAPSRQVLGYVGSGNYGDRSIQGMVDGLRARRSPGSALKPFIYGLAIDQGLIHPRSLLVDAPMAFGDYNPENFEGEFMGPVTAREALVRSRNIPAVDLARRLQGEGLYGFLKHGGVRLDRPESYYGLSISLGGAGITPLELARLYAALADDGVSRPLVFRTGPPRPEAGPPLLSEAARFLVLDMLRGTGELGADYGFSRADPAVAWKTGTSHGFRDAWAAGVRGDHVLVVWMGNFSGRGNNALVARRTAAPLLFELFARLHLPDRVKEAPATVGQVDLCALSGCLPGPHCPHLVRGWFVPGVSPIGMCELHREILVDGSTGARVAWNDGRPGLRREVYEFWPPDMLALFRKAGLPRREPPAPENGTAGIEGLDPGAAPLILSPLPNRLYFTGTEDITLKAKPAAGVATVYWFCDEAFLGQSTANGGLPWQPTPGKRKLRVVDDHGRSATLVVTVKVP